MGCGTQCVKTILTIFNIVFFISGGIIAGLALWVRLDEEIWDVIEVINDEDNLIEVGTYLLIAVGGLIFIAGVVGCCGVCCNSRTALSLYCVFLGVVMIIEILAAVLTIIWLERARDDVIDDLKDDYEDEYYYRDDKWSDFARTMNVVQYTLECCGMDGQSDYTDEVIAKAMDGDVCNSTATGGRFLPATCFDLKSSGKRRAPDDVDCGHVNLDDPHTKDCEDELVDFFNGYAVMFIATAIVFAALEIFGLIFAICLLRTSAKYDH